MGLSTELISQFAKLTKNEKDTNKETIVYGQALKEGNVTYVQIDGSDRWTPVSTTAVVTSGNRDTDKGDRVTVMIKDHTATILGSTSSPAASDKVVQEQGKQITEFDILVAHKVTTNELNAINAIIENLKVKNAEVGNLEAITAKIETLEAKFASFDKVTVNEMSAVYADIESLRALFAEITDLETENLNAINAEIDRLTAVTGTFTYLASEFLEAANADIKNLKANKIDANFANIDYANIDKAVFDEFYAKSGLIENVIAESGTITGYLVGVTIKGDLIEANTLVADKLVIKGEDGLYYKLNTDGVTTEAEQTDENSLNGQVIAARSITATKISVSDLVAFGATIGGFRITKGSLYAGVDEGKETVDSSNRGVYLDKDGQFSIGDGNYFFRYYNDPIYYQVEYDSANDIYTSTDTELDKDTISDVKSNYDFRVYLGSSSEYDSKYYCIAETHDAAGVSISTPIYYPAVQMTDYYKTVNTTTLTPELIVPTVADNGAEVFLGTDSSGNEIYYYIKDNFKLKISAESILFGAGDQSATEDLKELMKRIKMGRYTHANGDIDPCIELSEGENALKQVITNSKTMFMDGSEAGTTIDKDGVDTKNATVSGDLRQGNYVWAVHGSRGNYGLMWKEATN